MQLIGRTNEKALLQSYVDSQQAEFIAMYGRRRVGKTFLIFCFSFVVSHNLLRWILPEMVLGSSSRKTTMRGYL